MANVNERILKEGTIIGATKLPVITIGLGRVSELKELDGTIWHDDNEQVVIAYRLSKKYIQKTKKIIKINNPIK